MDWFLGFKLNLVVNEQGAPLNVTLTPDNTDDLTQGTDTNQLGIGLLLNA